MVPAIEIQTERLILRRWTDADRAPFAALNTDPEVMRHFPAPWPAQQSHSVIDSWLAQFDSQGWSNWAVEVRRTGEFVGFIGLTVPRRRLPCSPCVEIGWRLARGHWGRGLASEAAREALRIGFERLGLAEIVSFTALGNLRSRAVMERIGMQDATENFEHPGVPEGHPLRPHCLYRLSRDRWSALRHEQPTSLSERPHTDEGAVQPESENDPRHDANHDG